MDCHSKERAEETGATKVAKSHYLDREDNKLKQYLAPPLFLHAVPRAAVRCQTAGREYL
jgi:nitrate reductase cytochrome c-type subunit